MTVIFFFILLYILNCHKKSTASFSVFSVPESCVSPQKCGKDKSESWKEKPEYCNLLRIRTVPVLLYNFLTVHLSEWKRVQKHEKQRHRFWKVPEKSNEVLTYKNAEDVKYWNQIL